MRKCLATTAIILLLAVPAAAKKVRIYDEYNRFEGTYNTKSGRMYDQYNRFKGTVQKPAKGAAGFRVYDEKNRFKGTVQPERDELKGWGFDRDED